MKMRIKLSPAPQMISQYHHYVMVKALLVTGRYVIGIKLRRFQTMFGTSRTCVCTLIIRIPFAVEGLLSLESKTFSPS